jgi:O-antigen/teichoic acid export membrane protein
MAFIKFLKAKVFGGHERSVKAKKNIIGLFLLQGFSIGINLVLIPVSLNLLNDYKYGVWITLFNLLSWIQIFDIGIGNGLRNKFTITLANKDIKSAKEYVSTSYILMGGISISLIVLFFIPWLLVDWAFVFNVNSSLAHDLFLLIGITFILTAIQFTFKLISTLLTADHKPVLSSSIFALSNALILVIFLLFKNKLNGDLVAIGTVYSVVPLIVLIISSLLFFNGKYKIIRPSITHFNKNKVKDLFSLGLQFFIIQIAVLVIFQTDSLIIAHALSPKEVTPYNVVFRYFGVIIMLAGLVMTPFWSAFTEANEKKDFIWIKKIIVFQLKLLFVLVFIILIMFLLAKDLIPLWLGREIELSQILLIGMAAYAIISIWNNIFSFFLNGISRTKVQMMTSVLGTIINIPLSIYFAKKLGVGGVILGTIISLSLFAIFGAIDTFKYLRNNE